MCDNGENVMEKVVEALGTKRRERYSGVLDEN
jgi:hypothetical protein